jgi:hypothetical protein
MRHYATQNACHELLAKSSIMWAPADFAQLPFGQHRDQSERRSHDRPSDHVLKYDVLQRRLPPYIGCERWMGRDEGRVGVGESDERLGKPVQRQGSPGDEKSHRADENGLLPTAHCPGQSKNGGSFVRQHELTIMLDHAALAGFFVEPAFDIGFECLLRHKFFLSKCRDVFVVLFAHARFLPSFPEGFSVCKSLRGFTPNGIGKVAWARARAARGANGSLSLINTHYSN